MYPSSTPPVEVWNGSFLFQLISGLGSCFQRRFSRLERTIPGSRGCDIGQCESAAAPRGAETGCGVCEESARGARTEAGRVGRPGGLGAERLSFGTLRAPPRAARWKAPPPADRPGSLAPEPGLCAAALGRLSRTPSGCRGARSPPTPFPRSANEGVSAGGRPCGSACLLLLTPGPGPRLAALQPWGMRAVSAANRPAFRRAAPADSGDFQKQQPDDDSAPSTSSSQSDLFSEETNCDNSNTSLTMQTVNANQQLSTEANVPSPSKEECGPCTDTTYVSLTTPTKRSCDSDSQSENDASPVKRPRLLDSGEGPEESSRSKQKSRRRCFQCQIKLELVQQELGSCRCGYVFCMLHRLPEQHDCTFDHMGRGREEAIMKMVKLDRKVGRSCQRIGEGCS
ncbi:AN1-type zinc finger protein 3 isoform X1 [Rhinatrema bivittatum]|uniref:AN1-type zinc finger protein 3 isoform X1 n=1 Tax=Rhinatrema bivittatum TaxID=194408 RepID=UPI00112C8F09|nr:AN1-type zinc finger protein 3 isoform X1 [Rhinatrema bivittatum]